MSAIRACIARRSYDKMVSIMEALAQMEHTTETLSVVDSELALLLQRLWYHAEDPVRFETLQFYHHSRQDFSSREGCR